MTADRTFWDNYFRVPLVQLNGVPLPRRSVLNFIGSVPSVEDDEANARTRIPLGGGGGPGGAVGSIQVHGIDGDDAIFHGADAIRNADGGFDFVRSGTSSRARSGWGIVTTEDATPVDLASITLPLALGDLFASVHARSTYYYAAGGAKGGAIGYEASFQRSSGVLARIGIVPLTAPGLSVGTVPGGINIDIDGNESITVPGTGIAATAIVWVTSLHIQIAVAP